MNGSINGQLGMGICRTDVMYIMWWEAAIVIDQFWVSWEQPLSLPHAVGDGSPRRLLAHDLMLLSGVQHNMSRIDGPFTVQKTTFLSSCRTVTWRGHSQSEEK